MKAYMQYGLQQQLFWICNASSLRLTFFLFTSVVDANNPGNFFRVEAVERELHVWTSSVAACPHYIPSNNVSANSLLNWTGARM